MISPDKLDAAQTFVLLNARLIDRHRYACLFAGGDAEAVVAALRPYQNADGGFGHGLEPEGRGPESQPLHVHAALTALDEVGQCRGPLVTRAVDYLAAVTAPDGGVPPVTPGGRPNLSSPLWTAEGAAPSGALLPTAGIAGLLLKNRVEHPWLAGATDFCWRAIASREETHPYEVEHCLTFLDHAPDRERAEREAARLGRLVREQRLVAVEPADPSPPVAPGYGPGEVHTPLDYAPAPTSLARLWFSDEEIAADLDALERAQGEDGGWTFRWRTWNPMTTLEWRGIVTIRALVTLRNSGRLP